MQPRVVGAFAVGLGCGALAVAVALSAFHRPAEPEQTRVESRRAFAEPVSGAERSDEPRLPMPIAGVRVEELRDTFAAARSNGRHEALDIPARTGAPVKAVAAGIVQKLFTSVRGGLTIYQSDSSGSWCFDYAHLDRYAAGLHEGEVVRDGDVIGYVGSTGDASPDAPNLHLAVFRLGPERQWWKGEAVDPLPLLRRSTP